MHLVRWILTIGWVLILLSLFHDPWSARLSDPGHPWSPLRIPAACVPIQGVCVPDRPAPLGTTVFWGAVVPASVLILLVFGHELWRRICPLSFLSQIPRALGWQRRIQRSGGRSETSRSQLARVPADSWLGRHYPMLQFGWLFLGLCGRILFFNADRMVLALWLLLTIAAAITVGWLYGGKSWCQYFCPMAPVQAVYSTPAGLLGSAAHRSENPITQSMCRTVLPGGGEQSACVACQQPCIDIDAERLYWSRLETPTFAFERYGYLGLVVGYFLYYYLYAGSWQYYFSGAWQRQADQLSLLLSPGLYLFGQPIPVPRLVAVPLVLGLCTWLGWRGGRSLERFLSARTRRRPGGADRTLVRHRLFALTTFLAFNFFFLFAGRPLLQLLPLWVQSLYDVLLVAVSTLWLQRTWRRSPAAYERENLAGRFRRQLERLDLDVGRFLDGRSLQDLNSHEVYVLAKVLPGFDRKRRQETYKGVVREALEEGYVNVASSLEVLQQMRRELDISDDEHRQVLDELGVEDPDLLDPDRRRSLEEQVRLNGYRRALERVLQLRERGGAAAAAGASPMGDSLAELQRAYGISAGEEELIRGGLSPTTAAARRAAALLARLPDLVASYRALHHPELRRQPVLVALLEDQLRHRKELTVRSILEALMLLGDDPEVGASVAELQRLCPLILLELLEREPWRQRLRPRVLAALSVPGPTAPSCDLQPPLADTLHHLETLLQDPLPLVRAAALWLIAALGGRDEREVIERAAALASRDPSPLVRTTAEALVKGGGGKESLAAFPDLEKRAFLATSDFFRRTHSDTLDQLAERAEIRRYRAGEAITEAGDTCRELLLLIEGGASVRHREGEHQRREGLRPGQMLDELEVLTHSASESTIVAEREGTRVLAVPVDSFDAMLDRDADFARRVLELESRQLQRLMRPGAG